MLIRVIGLIGIALLAIAVLVVSIGSTRLDRANRALSRDLLRRATPTSEWQLSNLDELPTPVARYLARALLDADLPRSVRLEQRGEMLLGGQWRPFTAVQHITAQPPGFVWDARVRFAPLIDARVIDAYHAGSGRLQAKLLGVLSVADADSSPALDSSELMRLLAEGPWLPSVLLPRDGLSWQALDTHTARATLTDGSVVARIDFHFDDQGDIVRIEGDRPRDVAGSDPEMGRWVGIFSDYVEHDGIRYPLEGEVSWINDNGSEPYWRGRIEEIAFDPS